MAEKLAEIAYDASLRRLDKQEELLGEIRSRTGVLLAASSVVASFLGRPVVEDAPLWLVVLAVGAFAVTLLASIYVLMPKRELVFALVGSRVYEELYEFRREPAELHRRLAYDLDRFWQDNDRTLQWVFRAFRLAAWALAAEVVLLLVSLSGTIG